MQSKHIYSSTLTQLVGVAMMFAIVLGPVVGATASDPDEFTTISHARRVALATLAYTADNDRVLPLSMSYSTIGNQWRTGSYTAVPSGWSSTAARDVEPRMTEEQSVALNAILPYVGSLSAYSAQGVQPYNAGFVPTTRRPRQSTNDVAFLYNGMLHAWPIDAVVTPGRLSLFHQNYAQNSTGYTFSTALLCCTIQGPDCRFNPDGYPQPGQTSCTYYGSGYGYVWFQPVHGKYFTTWVYGHRMVVATVEGGARSENYEAPIWPAYYQNANLSPWSAYDRQGVPGTPYWMTDCVKPGGHKPSPIFYAGYLRPDSEFNFTLQQCDFGGG